MKSGCFDLYQITRMSKRNVSDAMKIWHDQFVGYGKTDSFPDFWPDGKDTVESYLLSQIEKGNALVAKKDAKLVGYMAWMYFDFHDERTAFVPTIGSSAVDENEMSIFHALYAAAAQKWVRDNRFNHLWMTFYDHTDLRDMLYDIGFGSYVIDACQKTDSNITAISSAYKITKVVKADTDALLGIANEAVQHLSASPIFLNREPWLREDITDRLDKQHLFAAWDHEKMVGVTCFDVNQKHHFEKLTNTESAAIGSLDTYIKPEYRGKGIGKQLLQRVFRYCHEIGKPFLHVSFESANPDAIRFWTKYFKPVIRSVRRTVNKDANTMIAVHEDRY